MNSFVPFSLQNIVLNTLSINVKTVRKTLEKNEETSILTKDKRGSRVEKFALEDVKRKEAVLHICHFPTMELHYCRKDSKREYLHPDLKIKRMVEIFSSEKKYNGLSVSYNTYQEIFKSHNLPNHHPKKNKISAASAGVIEWRPWN